MPGTVYSKHNQTFLISGTLNQYRVVIQAATSGTVKQCDTNNPSNIVGIGCEARTDGQHGRVAMPGDVEYLEAAEAFSTSGSNSVYPNSVGRGRQVATNATPVIHHCVGKYLTWPTALGDQKPCAVAYFTQES